MRNHNAVALIYCLDQAGLAMEAESWFSEQEVVVIHRVVDSPPGDASIWEGIQDDVDGIVCIISDPFLRSQKALVDIYPQLTDLLSSNKIHFILSEDIAEYFHGHDLPMTSDISPEHRPSTLISYIRHWKEQADKGSLALNSEMLTTIYTAIGTLLIDIKEHGYLKASELDKSDILNISSLITTAKKIAAESLKEEKAIGESTSSHESKMNVSVKSKSSKKKKRKSKKKKSLLEKLVEAKNNEKEVDEEIIDDLGMEIEDLKSDVERLEAKATSGSPIIRKNYRYQRNAESVGKKANELADEGDLFGAIDLLENALEEDPDNIDLRYQLAGYIIEDNGDLDQATYHLERIHKSYPENLIVTLRLAELYVEADNFDKALACYEEAYTLDPESSEISDKVALLYHRLKPKKPRKKAKFLRRAYKLDKDNPMKRFLYAVVLSRECFDLGRSNFHLKKVIKEIPEFAEAHLELSRNYYSLGKLKEAGKYYKKAIRINDDLRSDSYEKGLRGKKVKKKSKKKGGKKGSAAYHLKPKGKKTRKMSEILNPETSVNKTSTVLITGATSGIGKATAEVYSSHGHRVILTGRRAKRLELMKEWLEGKFQNEVYTLNFDVRNPNEVRKAIESLPKNWKDIDVLINNAGLAKGFAPIQSGALEHWDEMIDTNIKGLLFLTRAISPLMVAKGEGHIINVGSNAGKEVYPSGNVYCATKFAVDGLTKAMRLDLYEHGIRVSMVSPGHVEETEFAQVRFDGDKEKAKIYNDFNPLTSADVAESIYFISSRPSWVNIQDIVLMGTQQAGSNFIDRSGRKYDK